MAVGTPTQRYANTLAGATNVSTISPSSNIAAGTVAILVEASGVASKVITSVTDNAGGNTWVVDATFNTNGLSFVSCQVATQITTSSVITINRANSTGGQANLWIQEVTGLAASSVFDKTASGSATSNTPSIGPTATLSQADEIVFSVLRAGDITGWAHGASYSDPTTPALSSPLRTSLEYKIVNATTAVSADGTFTTSGGWAALLATYKAAATAPAATAGINLTMLGVG